MKMKRNHVIGVERYLQLSCMGDKNSIVVSLYYYDNLTFIIDSLQILNFPYPLLLEVFKFSVLSSIPLYISRKRKQEKLFLAENYFFSCVFLFCCSH